ncbi:MAG: hypothetical protein RSD67_05515 [Oscillospiraceae bacterium]
MATYNDLSNFTYDEIEQMELTYSQLSSLSLDELIKIANEKLENVNLTDEKSNKNFALLKPFFSQLLFCLTKDVIHDAIKSVDWSKVLPELIIYLSNLK